MESSTPSGSLVSADVATETANREVSVEPAMEELSMVEIIQNFNE
jgi:hypothetical protein